VAKVRSPLWSPEAWGQLGKSVVFQRGRAGNIARAYVIGKVARTERQEQLRRAMSQAARWWREARWTANDLAAWELAAAQEPRPMNGQNLFVRYAVAAALAGKDWAVMRDLQYGRNAAGTDWWVSVAPVGFDGALIRWGATPGAMGYTQWVNASGGRLEYGEGFAGMSEVWVMWEVGSAAMEGRTGLVRVTAG
jgi:hypothetical protein